MGSGLAPFLFRAGAFPRVAYANSGGRAFAEKLLDRLDHEFKYEGIAEAVPRSFATTSYEQELADRLEETFPKLDMPVLFVQGRHDPVMPPEEFANAAASVRDGRLEFVDAGHFLHLERPDAVNALLVEFLD